MIDLSISADIKYLAQARLKVRCLMLDDKVLTDLVKSFSSVRVDGLHFANVATGELA